METAQIMQEELQQSVLLSEEDAEFEEDDVGDAMVIDSEEPVVPGSTLRGAEEADGGNSGGDHEIESASAKEITTEDVERPDAEGEPADQEDTSQNDEGSDSEADAVHEDEDEEDAFDDAEAPQDDEQDGISPDSDGEAETEEDEAEGVGAVKIKPGETDDESESDDNVSLASGASDAESADEYEEEVAQNDEDEEDESEGQDSNLCLFCKKDEENDPSEEFESYLTCKGCGDHAHQQCARGARALTENNGGAGWKCPECMGDEDQSDSEAESMPEDAEVNGGVEDGDISPASTRRSTASKIARDLLPPQRGANKPDSHSVFNQLVLDEDPMDGSRILRKRKTSSAEADEEIMSLRKRRRNTSEVSLQDEATLDQINRVSEADEAVRPRSARSLRLKISNPAALCTVMKKSRTSLVVKIRVGPTELRQMLSEKPKPKKRSGRAVASRSARSAAAARGSTAVSTSTSAAAAAAEPPMAPFMASSYTQPFYSFYDKETDELKGKPYGGILTEAEADTSKTLPTKDDRRRFDEAKQKADEEWRSRLLAMQAEMDVPVKKSKKTSGPASQIECIEFGGWEIDTWYAAPYPEEYSRNRVLYICEFCLKYMNSDYVAWRHKLKCPAKHPPGDEIYRSGSVSFFEVDGRKNPVYCQNLCLLAKLFLGSKTLYYDVEPFLFYVLCEYDDMGYHFVGYFSKEKRASSQNNVSCILTLPIHQRKGYGNLLIDFSYLLTRVEEKTGSPEKPLSDMGLVSYRNYWRLVLCKYLLEHTPGNKTQKKGLSIRQISDNTGMMPDDVISALEGLRCLVRDPQTQLYAFRVDLQFCREYVAGWESKNYVKLKEKALTWTPYVMGRSNATNFELGPALNAIAPREEDEDTKEVQVIVQGRVAAGELADTDGASQQPLAQVESTTVLESTEPNDNAMDISQEPTKANGIEKENGKPQAIAPPQEFSEANDAAKEDMQNDWIKSYNNVPAIRFEVFPPVNPKRPAASRMNSSMTRPAVVRTPATAPRPRPRRSVGGSSRKSASRPKSSTSVRRKTGGTGRGPGRWPKGTKKSDYGNADSGPGLPPAWLEQQRSVTVSKGSAENETQDTVEVKEAKQGRGKKSTAAAAAAAAAVATASISAIFEVKDDTAPPAETDSSSNEESGSGKAEEEAESDRDVVMGEDRDDEEDAEAEDE
ncbi:uncharacterized protein BCR38DRAFT_345958 [Pseudomassariella vexata]|uniref:Histone acetyltransferase n=1 Tax=Pseudomassariella vexata TaxID=1141098 RepID=A0A1Y2DTB7_9PEZI|nr:uncharacterized protein BCR38DRAFT_345958 [Pseudomassariella vexata]ORY62510.1 hypothetical protein BCR38DRAFT_345958 [Pseudomassariella vexata]